MRVYHFLSKKWALDDITRRRIRISRIESLNDPFELMSFAMKDPQLRLIWSETIQQLGADKGLICFSKDWSNPVMWGHYAERHQGICLGLDVPNDVLKAINYVRKRMASEILNLIGAGSEEEAFTVMQQMLFTKYSHWRYEAEVRCYANLGMVDDGNYFLGFSDDVCLREVIVGIKSTTTRAEVAEALGSLSNVEIFKTRPATSSFRVVRDRRQSNWT